jgi:hypothetical protein
MHKGARLPTVYLHAEQDADLVAWIEGLGQQPGVNKSQIIKDVLRRGLGQSHSDAVSPVQAGASCDTADLLTEIRRVLEATLESTLSRLPMQGTGGGEAVVEQEVADEMEAILDSFASSLLLAGEEEG